MLDFYFKKIYKHLQKAHKYIFRYYFVKKLMFLFFSTHLVNFLTIAFYVELNLSTNVSINVELHLYCVCL